MKCSVVKIRELFTTFIRFRLFENSFTTYKEYCEWMESIRNTVERLK